VSDEFDMLEVICRGVFIAVHVRWLPFPEGGAVRKSDGEIWDGGQLCQCLRFGYDHTSIDAVLEAQRLGIAHAPRVVDCAACGRPTCDRCVDQTGTMCLRCCA